MTLDEYLEYYNNNFKIAYADTVALIADKPKQIVVEQENSLSHLVLYLEDNTDIENLKKAKGHIERATLDCYKMSFVELKKKLKIYTEIDPKNPSLAFNLATNEVMDRLRQFDANVIEARRLELSTIGRESNGALEKYAEAVNIGFELLNSVDKEKYNSIGKLNLKYILKNHAIGFILGVIASIIATKIMSW